MTRKESYEWIDNNFYGDLTEEEMKKNLKAMVDRIYNSFTEEHIATTDENGHLIGFPQFVRFSKNTEIEIYSKETK